jgi:ribonuclease HII
MTIILGIDEVGRGAWAGPMAVGAVVLDSNSLLCHPEFVSESNQLKDSKKLTKKQREKLAREIRISARAIGVGWVSAREIDSLGLSPALKLAAWRAVAQIPREIWDNLDEIIIDGTIRLIDDARATTLIRADAKVSAVSAAAIVAKVFRDSYMTQLDRVFPDYEFARHVGYGTAAHLNHLQKFGAIAGIHRVSFAPIAKLTDSNISTALAVKKIEKTAGRIAENVAVEFLRARGHQIVAQNWRTKWCEIDIISARNETLYFTEVKYRENANFGDGLDAITTKKLRQMRRAAEIFLAKHDEFAREFDVKIAAISLSQNPPQVDEFIENVDI